MVSLPAETIGKPDELTIVIQRYHGFENKECTLTFLLFKETKIIFERKIKASQADI